MPDEPTNNDAGNTGGTGGSAAGAGGAGAAGAGGNGGAGSAGAGDDHLGDAGKRALDEERTARKAAEKQARDAQAELDKIRASTMSEQEKAVAAAKAEGRTEALQTANERLVRAEIRAAAAGKLADPSDAVGLLGDLSTFIDKDGDVNSKAITSAIDALVKSKPYLSARPGNGSGEGGPRGGAPAASGSARIDQQIRRSAGV